MKRTYNLSAGTVEKVRELAGERLHVTQDALVEMAVDDLARRIEDSIEAQVWEEAARDPEFMREAADIAAAYSRADNETWP